MKKITVTVENEGGEQIMCMTASLKTELVLIDLGLPGEGSTYLLNSLRESVHAPIMVLTLQGKDTVDSVAQDDPHDHSTLAAKNENKTEAGEQSDGKIIANGPIRMDLTRHEVYIKSHKIFLTPREYDLLHCFLLRQGKILPHSEILKEVWGPEHLNDTQYLRVYIGQLRNKLEASPGLGKLIVAEAGVGYRMDRAANVFSHAA